MDGWWCPVEQKLDGRKLKNGRGPDPVHTHNHNHTHNDTRTQHCLKGRTRKKERLESCTFDEQLVQYRRLFDWWLNPPPKKKNFQKKYIFLFLLLKVRRKREKKERRLFFFFQVKEPPEGAYHTTVGGDKAIGGLISPLQQKKLLLLPFTSKFIYNFPIFPPINTERGEQISKKSVKIKEDLYPPHKNRRNNFSKKKFKKMKFINFNRNYCFFFEQPKAQQFDEQKKTKKRNKKKMNACF